MPDIISTATQRIENQTKFKNDCLDLYKCTDSDPAKAVCMATGLVLPKSNVIASHIMPLANRRSMRAMGLTRHDIWNPRNGMLLYKSIEKAFDRMEIVSFFISIICLYLIFC